MITGIDHIVVVVPKLEPAKSSYSQLGFTVVPGGSHPAYGSRNALVAFADRSYIELIAFENPALKHPWSDKLTSGGGLIDFCFRTSDLRTEVKAFRGAGIDISDPSPLTRTRPDGYLLKWVLAIPARDSGVVPFLIEDETPRDERVPQQSEHRNGVLGIAALTLALDSLNSLERIGAFYSRVLGAQPSKIDRLELEASGLSFPAGSSALELVTSTRDRGPVADWIRSRGSSPFAARFRSASTNHLALDPSLTAGAQFSIG
jgi:catechol 2,3-dioxygenase-like lactoylglutathione lyase family enzyme